MKKMMLALLMLCVLLLSACTAVDVTPKDCGEVSQAILNSQTFAPDMTRQSDKRMMKALNLEDGTISAGTMTIDASRTTAEAVVVLTASSADTLPQVQSALNGYRDSQLAQYRTYKPEEVPKLEAAQVYTRGLQVVLVVAPDQGAAKTALDTAWK